MYSRIDSRHCESQINENCSEKHTRLKKREGSRAKAEGVKVESDDYKALSLQVYVFDIGKFENVREFQSQGGEGAAVVHLLQALDNTGSGTLWRFQKRTWMFFRRDTISIN